MSFKISANLPLPDHLFVYDGRVFELNRTIKGRIKPLTKEELTRVKEHLGSIFDEVVKEGLDLANLGAFDLTTKGKPTFYCYNNADNLYVHGFYADKTYEIAQPLINNLLGAKTKTPSESKDFSSAKPSNEVELHEGFNSTEIAKNFEDGTRINAKSLGAYSLLLENRYNTSDNRIMILDPAIVQDSSKIRENKKIAQAVALFNDDLNLKTIYLPVHLGSRPGHRDGHWILLALTRSYGTDANTAVVYNSMGANKRDNDLLEYLGEQIDKGDKIVNIAINDDTAHQKDGSSCGVHVLHFIETMEKLGFDRALKTYMHGDSLTEDANATRKRFALEIKNADAKQFQVNKAEESLRAAKVYHLDKKSENKFVGITELKKIHSAQLEFFKENEDNPAAIRNNHFDWWTFPINAPSETYKNLYALDDESIKALQKDSQFLNMYFESVQRVLAAYGWQLSRSKDNSYNIKRLEDADESLRIEEVRLSKMVQSSFLLIPKLHGEFVAWAQREPSIKRLIRDPRTKKAFRPKT